MRKFSDTYDYVRSISWTSAFLYYKVPDIINRNVLVKVTSYRLTLPL